MNPIGSDKVFAGAIPELYDSLLVPLIFEPYAADLAQRLAAHPPARLLEIAAGTGVVTRAMAAALPESTTIVATDLNPAMLERAQARGTRRPVRWQQADALELGFQRGEFDGVICQFGVMFFPDKAKAFGEARRVLRPGGTLLFNVWDRIQDNEFSDVVTAAIARMFPADPPSFMARTPHGYHDRESIVRDLKQGGFTATPEFVTVTHRSRASSAKDAAIALCQGTPLRNEIETRHPGRLNEVTEAGAQALAQRFGQGAIEGKIQALVIQVTA